MGRESSMNSSEEDCIEVIGGKSRGRKATRKSKMDLKVGWGSVDWISLA
jgi:hypothetical protein